jgi:hypothetical protein
MATVSDIARRNREIDERIKSGIRIGASIKSLENLRRELIKASRNLNHVDSRIFKFKLAISVAKHTNNAFADLTVLHRDLTEGMGLAIPEPAVLSRYDSGPVTDRTMSFTSIVNDFPDYRSVLSVLLSGDLPSRANYIANILDNTTTVLWVINRVSNNILESMPEFEHLLES